MANYPPSSINETMRLSMVGHHYGPELFDDAAAFDRVFGVGRFAETDGDVLRMARSIVESTRNRRVEGRSKPGQAHGETDEK